MKIAIHKLWVFALAIAALPASAQNTEVTTESTTIELREQRVPIRKAYIGNSFDAAIFSTSFLSKEGNSSKTTPLRFSMWFHIGATYNYNFNSTFGVYTGLDLKNIGFIEKADGYKMKKRVYTLGIPVGVRIGDLKDRFYFLAGGGADLAINYKEKTWDLDDKKHKFNEWFSSRTPLVMPYVFAGVCFHPGVVVKVQYYPVSFLNQDFTETKGGVQLQPYAAYDKVNLLLFSLGFDMKYKVRSN
jgi:hypothetical protein